MAELNLVEKVIALEAVDLFRGLDSDQLSRIAAIARTILLPPGRTLLTATQEIEGLFVIVDGELELSREGEVFHVARRGEVLGSWALFDAAPLALEARTLGDAVLLRIIRGDFFDLLGDNMQITQSIFATLVRRFRQLAGH